MERASPPSPLGTWRGGVGQVSWLEAASLAFPGARAPSGMESARSEGSLGPLTVAGPRRIHTGFR